MPQIKCKIGMLDAPSQTCKVELRDGSTWRCPLHCHDNAHYPPDSICCEFPQTQKMHEFVCLDASVLQKYAAKQLVG